MVEQKRLSEGLVFRGVDAEGMKINLCVDGDWRQEVTAPMVFKLVSKLRV